MGKLSILTWNLRHGGGKRISAILDAISDNANADIIVLTEFRNNQNKSTIENGLKEFGYSYIKTLNVEPKLNSVLIASKKEFESQDFPNLREHKQRVIRIDVEGYKIYGCYFPGQNLKKEVFEFLLSEMEDSGIENIIITGDINTGKHYLDEKGATFFHSDYLDKFEEKGLVDAWRKIHGDKREFTWYSNAGNGFRIDHFFVDGQLSERITNCEYIHEYRVNNISDHSMMVLELNNE